jgi:hypothetical protein|tara:strand:- start:141 stop:545 length:405 start_codon:yes stop_codon:yes gene_type:complete
MWFALCADGTLSVLGDHGDYESADKTAEDLGLDVIWLIPGDDAAQWADTINSKQKEKKMRPLNVIATEIENDWQEKVNFAARPYLDAMHSLNTVTDHFGMDTADSIVRYFLSNATTWRGPVARSIKAELKAMIK